MIYERPVDEPGWEIIDGEKALEAWGPKDRNTMEIWLSGEWATPDKSDYYCSTWYRRPAPYHPAQEHFI